MNTASFQGINVPGVRPPAGGFVHATVVAAGSDLVFISGQTPEGWLIESEVIAARSVAEVGPEP